MSCVRANAAQVKYKLRNLVVSNMYISHVHDTRMGVQPNLSSFHGLLSLDIYQLTVTCFVIMLTLYYVLIRRVLKLTYALILLVRVKKCINLRSPAGKQPGETKYKGSDQSFLDFDPLYN